jgi:hypothetical protein
MGIKLGSVVMMILLLFIAKISFEASVDVKPIAQKAVATTAGRTPASIQSIDESYQSHLNGTGIERH